MRILFISCASDKGSFTWWKITLFEWRWITGSLQLSSTSLSLGWRRYQPRQWTPDFWSNVNNVDWFEYYRQIQIHSAFFFFSSYFHSFPAELHIIHYNQKYGDFETASEFADGLAVLAIMIEVYIYQVLNLM